ncbi:nitrate reductase molybdenum cofactor assembly chaperone [Metabacillus malikii]|uniref:Nitrate reductase delta subunit n=1 Tax=Metabacillus malikii TaxID=1504265 RepID=A0ABT9ZCG1_9BACI|nr:nitrate reductase molybdenum cofactor assembly chaperone [Metabacillus malikii]MDQ0229960.1 nitrate reductase delta subunit [Metabacillus malikii]
MTNEEKVILVIMSRVLDYPETSAYDEYSSIKDLVKEHFPLEKNRKEIFERLNPLYKLSILELQKLYVETFDYKEKTGLYLTAHELGDSRKRGAALIKLQKMVCEAGFEHGSKELVDYIPLLLELLAYAPSNENFIRLKQRLSFAIHRISEGLSKNNPYHQVLELSKIYIFEAPEEEELIQLENQREKADLDELPYPITYQ